MSAIICKLDRESICATCLSQDRKLFSLSDVQMCEMFSLELSMTDADRICWECHETVRKIMAFKNKAQKAQVWLQAAMNSHPSEIPHLSSLAISKGIFLGLTEPGLTSAQPPPLLMYVKQEVIDENAIGSTVQTKVGTRNRESEDEESGVTVKEELEIGPAILTPKPKKQKAPTPTVENPTQAPNQPIYTELELTEEGMLEWWETKKKMKYFTQCIPLERCDLCVQPLDGLMHHDVHAKKHTDTYGAFKCDICTLHMTKERKLDCHKKLHYRILKCRDCEFVWDTVNALRQHCSDMHGIKQTAWECDQCRKQYPSQVKFSHHLRTHRCTKCPECSKSVTEYNLKLHLVQHRGGKPLRACAECGGHFRGAEGLKAHMRTHNTEVDPAAYCAQCNIQYRDMVLYRAHLKSNKHVAQSEFQYKCKVCDMKFVKFVRLRSHMDIHKGIVYPCDHCGKSFKRRKSRDWHVKTKHEGVEPVRDKLCDYCGRGFSSKGQLSSHINTHTGARPFVCKLCGADFGHKSALYLHGRYKHKIQKKNADKASSGKSSGKANSGKDNMDT